MSIYALGYRSEAVVVDVGANSTVLLLYLIGIKVLIKGD